MSHHAVLGAHSEAVEVPLAAHILPGDWVYKTLGGAQILDETRHLGHGRDVAHEHAARNQRMGDGLDVLPRGKHVEHDPVNATFLGRPQHLVNVTNAQIPRRVAAAEPQIDVGSSDVSKVLAALYGNQTALRANRIQESHRQRAGASAGLDDGRAGEDITHVGDDARVLGVDDGGAAGHRHHVVNLERAQNLKLTALLGDDHLAVRAANNVVMVESAAVGLETAPAHKNHLMEAALGVANLNAVALGKDTSAGRLAKIVGRHRIITLNSHYVNDTACHLLRPWKDTDEGGRG